MQRSLVRFLVGFIAAYLVIVARDSGLFVRMTERQYRVLLAVSVFISEITFELLVVLVS